MQSRFALFFAATVLLLSLLGGAVGEYTSVCDTPSSPPDIPPSPGSVFGDALEITHGSKDTHLVSFLEKQPSAETISAVIVNNNGSIVRDAIKVHHIDTTQDGANLHISGFSGVYRGATNSYVVAWQTTDGDGVGRIQLASIDVETGNVNAYPYDDGFADGASLERPMLAYSEKEKFLLMAYSRRQSGLCSNAYVQVIFDDFTLGNRWALGTNSTSNIHPSVDYSTKNNDFIAVWEYRSCDGGPTSDPWMMAVQAVSKEGKPKKGDIKPYYDLGLTTNASTALLDSHDARIAYSRLMNRFYVTWIYEEANSAGDLVASDVYMRKVQPTTAYTIAGRLQFSSGTDTQDTHARPAFFNLSSTAYVVWQSHSSKSGENSVHAGTGTIWSRPPKITQSISVSKSGAFPGVGWFIDESKYLVGWMQKDGNPAIHMEQWCISSGSGESDGGNDGGILPWDHPYEMALLVALVFVAIVAGGLTGIALAVGLQIRRVRRRNQSKMDVEELFPSPRRGTSPHFDQL